MKHRTEAEDGLCDPYLVARLVAFLERNAEWIVSEDAWVNLHANVAEPAVEVTHEDSSELPVVHAELNRRLVAEGFETAFIMDAEPERWTLITILAPKPGTSDLWTN
ncbi:MAG: hypothetical protein DMG30_01765 [Acidobacteria bacterium]|nr:MAG: hypothetical protein DMG30_01765 [Acidobacteriota bacterium]